MINNLNKNNNYKTMSDDKLSEVIHQVSHDIGNPLTSIITYCSLVEQSENLQIPYDKISAYAKSMQYETWKVSGLMEKLVLLLSNRSTTTKVHLKDIGTKIMSRYQNRYGLGAFDIELIGFDINASITADPEQLCSILCEMLTNAGNAIIHLESKNSEVERFLSLSASIEDNNSIVFEITNQTADHSFTLDDLKEIGISENNMGKKLPGIGIPAIINTAIRWGGEFTISETKNEDINIFSAKLKLPAIISEE